MASFWERDSLSVDRMFSSYFYLFVIKVTSQFAGFCSDFFRILVVFPSLKSDIIIVCISYTAISDMLLKFCLQIVSS